MYPRVFLESFWQNDLTNEVFVAMSFKEEFERRWTEIIEPAVSEIKFSGESLKAVRVDIRKRGDSILTEIMDGICHSQLVIADVSVTNRWKEDNKNRWCRNGNVMYEVGLAVACRQPSEVILIRDDDDDLLFDISHIPVVKYDPDNVDESKNLIKQLVLDRLRERKLEKDIRISKTLDTLSESEIYFIAYYAGDEDFMYEGYDSPATFKTVLPRLLDKQILRCVDIKKALYTWTIIGRVIANIVSNRVGNVIPSWRKKRRDKNH